MKEFAAVEWQRALRTLALDKAKTIIEAVKQNCPGFE